MRKRRATELLTGLEKLPANEDHLLADYVELRCLVSRDGEYALADLLAASRRQKDLGVAGTAGIAAVLKLAGGDGPLAAVVDGAEEVPAPKGDQPARELAAAAGPDDPLPEDPEPGSAELEGSTRSGRVMGLLRRREQTFGSDYPFALTEGGVLRLSRRLGDGQRLYLFLLVASCYRNIADGGDRQKLTSGFERLAVPVLQRYFGERLEAFVFGTAAEPGERYHGGLKKAVQKLATDTGFRLTDEWEEHHKELAESGDRGLDVVGWIPFDSSDPADLRFVIFGQCATGRNWERKQLEADAGVWGRMLQMTGPLANALFISFSWRRAGGRWHNTLKLTTRNIVFDRDRIVRLLSGRKIDLPIKLMDELRALTDADDL